MLARLSAITLPNPTWLPFSEGVSLFTFCCSCCRRGYRIVMVPGGFLFHCPSPTQTNRSVVEGSLASGVEEWRRQFHWKQAHIKPFDIAFNMLARLVFINFYGLPHAQL